MSLAYGSPWDGYSRAPLRIGLAAIAGLVFLGEAWSVARMASDPHFAPKSPGVLQFLPNTPALAWALFGLAAVGLLFVALGRWTIAAGLWAITWMAVLSQWQIELFGTPSRNCFFPGAMLFGWVLGAVWARVVAGPIAETPEGRPFRESLAEAGAMACIAAGYVGSALSKLFASGFGWVNPSQIRWLVLSQEPLAAWPWLLSYRQALVESPDLARLSALLTLVIEGGSFVLLFGARWRLAWAWVICALHVNIILLCTMPYFEPMSLLLLFALPFPRIFGRPRIEDPLLERRPAFGKAIIPDAMWILLCVLIVLAWIAPVGWGAG
ncbi:hypothetical protein [Polyangium spumosum]|uniref:HTTM domain-containing protein n=1 Tax=Polyangium spumosum TaxID=889282 RepID=A0A6N7PZW5_9BACT|nr:hypothetical protein [Polyangium spumosum]MRG97648.1 hypothetical protein [Polyangium spumosum]